MLNNQDVKVLKRIGELQEMVMELSGGTAGLIFFMFKNVVIVNPFIDEISSAEVDPVTYYGDSFVQSGFMDYVNKL